MDNQEQQVYKVLFKGVILPGFEKEQVIKNIHNLTKIPIETITRKFFSGKTVVIRHAEDRFYAEQLQMTFAELGIQTTIEEMTINEDSSNTDDDFYNDFNEQKSNKNLIAKIIIALIAGITSIFFFFPTEEKNIPPENSETSITAPIKQKASPSLKKVEESVPSTETASNKNTTPDDLSPQNEPPPLPPEVGIQAEAIDILPIPERQTDDSEIKNDELTFGSEQDNVQASEIAGYQYGQSSFSLTIDELVSLLKTDDPDYMDYFNRNTVKLLSANDELKEIDIKDGISLHRLGDIFIVTKEDKILSITLQMDFLFKDSSELHGSYSLRVLPIIKRKYPLFLSKFFNQFNDKDKKWWDRNIKSLKEKNQAELIYFMDEQHTVIIKYRTGVSNYSSFSLSDYANKQLFKDRLSLTILKN